jgi:DNA-directed RNA polymerase subunit RPC12/RpoP
VEQDPKASPQLERVCPDCGSNMVFKHRFDDPRGWQTTSYACSACGKATDFVLKTLNQPD